MAKPNEPTRAPSFRHPIEARGFSRLHAEAIIAGIEHKREAEEGYRGRRRINPDPVTHKAEEEVLGYFRLLIQRQDERRRKRLAEEEAAEDEAEGYAVGLDHRGAFDARTGRRMSQAEYREVTQPSTRIRPPDDDPTCEHGVAWDVHCCNCHSGFVFDSQSCVCRVCASELLPPPQGFTGRRPEELAWSGQMQALRFLAGMCDGAAKLDDRGFSKHDSEEGHRLARSAPGWSTKDADLAAVFVWRYRKQLKAAGFEVEPLGKHVVGSKRRTRGLVVRAKAKAAAKSKADGEVE